MNRSIREQITIVLGWIQYRGIVHILVATHVKMLVTHQIQDIVQIAPIHVIMDVKIHVRWCVAIHVVVVVLSHAKTRADKQKLQTK